jgi:hypothetical protein
MRSRVATRRARPYRGGYRPETPYQPWCGRCGHISARDALFCERCDNRLFPASFYPERRR